MSLRGKIALVLCAIVVLSFLAAYPSTPPIQEQLSLTYLDSLNLSDLIEIPAKDYEHSSPVSDSTIYGTSLVLYQNPYDAMGQDPYFGRTVTLRNIETGEEIRTAFTGGADGGIDLQNLKQGVYEIYVENNYVPARAYMEEEYESEPFITVRDNKQVESIQLRASKDYLKKFGVQTDKNYLYLTVTDTLPIVKVADVVIDPSDLLVQSNGNVVEAFSQPGFSEAQSSWELAGKIKDELEKAGLRVVFSHQENEASGYLGNDSRTAAGYDAQAKIFLSLAVNEGDDNRPFVVSSPFTNGRLGNDIVTSLQKEGVELSPVSSLDMLNPGNSFDLLSTDEHYEYTPFSLQPALRETGGKVTSTGKLENWSENAKYSAANGMNAVLFLFASSESQESITYYQEHSDAIAKGIAKGILDYVHVEPGDHDQSEDSQKAGALIWKRNDMERKRNG